jgi:hypothetical protein
MKKYILMLIMLISICCFAGAQEDSLLIVLKNGKTEVIPLSKLSKITFANVTSVENDKTSEPGLNLVGVYPNPLTVSTEIKFSLETCSDVVITIYNNLGVDVFRITQNNLSPGINSFHWTGKDTNQMPLSSGVYFIELRTALDVKLTSILVIR